ncbi:hypothetical protein GW17_00033866 [Ensete ventricosum]|nr:hypothetical protein GW17_00033866 [Ensete ventricosum]
MVKGVLGRYRRIKGRSPQVAAAEQRVVAVEQRANDLQANNDKLMAQLVEVTQRMELSDKELNDAGADLFDAQRELME